MAKVGNQHVHRDVFLFFVMYFHEISIFRKKTDVPMQASEHNLCQI